MQLHLAGRRQLSLATNEHHASFVSRGVLERLRRHRGNAHQHLQIRFEKRLVGVDRIEVDQSQGAARRTDQRGRHLRMRVAGGHGVVVRPVVDGQDRLAVGDQPMGDRAADRAQRGRAFAFAPALLGGSQGQLPRLIQEHDVAAIGLRKDIEQTVEHVGQKLLHVGSLPQSARDFQHGP